MSKNMLMFSNKHIIKNINLINGKYYIPIQNNTYS